MKANNNSYIYFRNTETCAIREESLTKITLHNTFIYDLEIY